jgi:hypothetical protein
MVIRSPSISSERSDLIGHHEPPVVRARWVDVAGEVVTDLKVIRPLMILLESLPPRLAMPTTRAVRNPKL